MRRNVMRLVAVVLAAGTLTLVGAPKDASAVSLNLINDWKMGDVGTLGNVSGTGSVAGHSYAGSFLSGSYVPRLGINFHLGIGFGRGDQVVPYLGFAMDRVQLSDDLAWDGEGDSELETNGLADGVMMVFGLEIGGKFFLVERAKGKAPPFIQISFHKYFASLDAYSDDDDYDASVGNLGEGQVGAILMNGYEDIEGDDDPDAAGYQIYDNQRHSPLGFKFAFGAEYYFNDNFALGGTFFGIEFNYAQSRLLVDGIDMITRANEFNFYTSLSMTYRFSFTVRASVQFESDYDYED